MDTVFKKVANDSFNKVREVDAEMSVSKYKITQFLIL